jgi:alpha-glucosidase
LSSLTLSRRLLALRRDHPVLKLGEIAFRDAPAPLAVFERRLGEERVLCAFNLGPDAPPSDPAWDEGDTLLEGSMGQAFAWRIARI